MYTVYIHMHGGTRWRKGNVDPISSFGVMEMENLVFCEGKDSMILQIRNQESITS